MDRCHRIGQKNPVLVFRLATANSVEGHMLRRAASKMALERLIIKKGAFKEVEEVSVWLPLGGCGVWGGGGASGGAGRASLFPCTALTSRQLALAHRACVKSCAGRSQRTVQRRGTAGGAAP
jgi:hypothetical protein